MNIYFTEKADEARINDARQTPETSDNNSRQLCPARGINSPLSIREGQYKPDGRTSFRDGDDPEFFSRKTSTVLINRRGGRQRKHYS